MSNRMGTKMKQKEGVKFGHLHKGIDLHKLKLRREAKAEYLKAKKQRQEEVAAARAKEKAV